MSEIDRIPANREINIDSTSIVDSYFVCDIHSFKSESLSRPFYVEKGEINLKYSFETLDELLNEITAIMKALDIKNYTSNISAYETTINIKIQEMKSGKIKEYEIFRVPKNRVRSIMCHFNNMFNTYIYFGMKM